MASTTITHPDPPADPSRPAFIPLEANPEVMTGLLRRLGLSSALAMHDVYSITEPELLAFVPRPALALLLVFPVSAAYEAQRLAEDAGAPEYDGRGPAEPVLWFRQTIRNACGLMGLLHAVGNGPARGFVGSSFLFFLFFFFVPFLFLFLFLSLFPLFPFPISPTPSHSTLPSPNLHYANSLTHPPLPPHTEPNSTLDKLIQDATPLGPTERSALLEQTPDLAAAHQEAASGGATAAPDAQDDVDLHYVCFVKTEDGTLWELDGRRKGPIARGKLDGSSGEEEDVLCEKALLWGPLKFLEREGGDLRFSCVALAGALD